VILLLCGRGSPRSLVIAGVSLLIVGVLLWTGFGLLTTLTEAPRDASAITQPGTSSAGANPGVAASPEMPSSAPPFERLPAEMRAGRVRQPQDPLWLALETEAYQRGPYERTSRVQELVIPVTIYLGQLLVVGPVWLKFFRSGPMEWVWRSFTCLRPHRLSR
jgi:uncharacterized membrane protein YeiB